ncbi:MAG TPA: nitroreductase [Opitutaceae bacterium]
MQSPFPYRSRRTIKPGLMDACREVPGEVLLEILEDAHWAPSHGLNQPWRFHVFTGEGRSRLAGALQSLYDQVTPVAEARPEKRAKLRDGLLQAPVCIAVAAQADSGGKVSRMDEICATACAVQNLQLSAHQRGIGSYWSTPPVACRPEFAKWLGLDAKYVALGLVYLGYPKEGIESKSTRVPLGERVIFHNT